MADAVWRPLKTPQHNTRDRSTQAWSRYDITSDSNGSFSRDVHMSVLTWHMVPPLKVALASPYSSRKREDVAGERVDLDIVDKWGFAMAIIAT